MMEKKMDQFKSKKMAVITKFDRCHKNNASYTTFTPSFARLNRILGIYYWWRLVFEKLSSVQMLFSIVFWLT